MFKKSVIILSLLAFINLFVCPFSLAEQLILENGTTIPLKLVDNISSGTFNEGDQVNFVVEEDIKIGEIVLIKEGTRAAGYISELTSRGRIGKPGHITINFDHIKSVNGKKIPLTGQLIRKGNDKLVLTVALGICLTPLFLLMRGTDATLPAGYKVQARVDRDTVINLDNNKL